jgi:hypothetical protein
VCRPVVAPAGFFGRFRLVDRAVTVRTLDRIPRRLPELARLPEVHTNSSAPTAAARFKGNLHYEAWDIADELVLKMRKGQ